MEFPVFVKAVVGGGGRGMRRVGTPAELPEALGAAMREAEAAFGDPAVYLEQAVIDARHIEVQVLADAAGNVIHLFDRDCSVQRRHQKVVELAPAPHVDPELRQRICVDAVAFARAIGYVNAGTVEFLVDQAGRHVFIEMNPRIQVEHTVTEEVTDVDLVQAQLRIAAGETLPGMGLSQDAIVVRGTALQCRITTEDPANGFRPATGRITVYRSPGGAGVRLDGGTALGAEIEADFDSLLVKLTCRGRDLPAAIRRARRALAEFRIRGVPTNIAFLTAVLDDPDFRAGQVTTSFIEDHPELLAPRIPADRGTKLLTYLADVTVNRPHGHPPRPVDPVEKLPRADLASPPPGGSRQRLRALGPEEFARELRRQTALAVTDTTFRDAHQSLLATRVRSRDLLAVTGHVARSVPQLLSLEAWGGATYDVALRYLHEDPWERLAAVSEAVPNICLQMPLRGRNTVGYTPYPETVTEVFVREAAAAGIDIFRIFDALNDVNQMRAAIEAVRSTGTAVAEVALCYTADLSDPGERLYTLDYYLRLAEQIVSAGAHVLAIKDMAGLLRPPRPPRWSPRCGNASTCPSICTPTTPPEASSPPCWPRGRRGRTPSTAQSPPWPARPVSRRCRRSSLPPITPTGPPALACRPLTTLSPTGKQSAACTLRSNPACPRRLAASTATRFPRPAVQPATAGHRAGPGPAVRGRGGRLRRRQPAPRPARQGHPFIEGRGRPGAAVGRNRCQQR